MVRDGKAVEVTLTDAGSHGDAWIVTDGLDPGDSLIVDGLKNLRNGDAVTAVAVTIGDDGLTHPVEAAPAEATPEQGAQPAPGN